jgi:hypothetical protein
MSEGERLLDLIKDVSGKSFGAWLDALGVHEDAEVWHVPAWLAQKNGFDTHDSSLGLLIVGRRHRTTDKAVKFDNNVGVFGLKTTRHHEYTENGRVRDAWTEDHVVPIGEWQQTVQECVGEDELSSQWLMKRITTDTYWPLSQCTELDVDRDMDSVTPPAP